MSEALDLVGPAPRLRHGTRANLRASLRAYSHSLLEWHRAGFRPHVIIPPDGELHPATKIRPQDRGKSPGIRRDGAWTGFDWRKLVLDRENLPSLQAEVTAGAGIGVRTGEGHVWIDCDLAGDEEASFALLHLTQHMLGKVPLRVGRYPKWAACYVCGHPEIKSRAWEIFDKGGTKLGGLDMLGQGKQVVVQGTHPGTGEPYRWSEPPLSIAEAPGIEPGKLAEWVVAVSELAAERGWTMKGSGSSLSAVLGGHSRPVQPEWVEWPEDPDVLAAMVRTVPNEDGEERDEWVKMGYAIKGALPADPDRAFEIWWEWSQKWQPEDGRRNTIEHCEAKWRGMRAPYRIGWGYLWIKAGMPVFVKDLVKPALGQMVFERDPLPDWVEPSPPPPPPSLPLPTPPKPLPAVPGPDAATLEAAREYLLAPPRPASAAEVDPEIAFAQLARSAPLPDAPPDDADDPGVVANAWARALGGRVLWRPVDSSFLMFSPGGWVVVPLSRHVQASQQWMKRWGNAFFGEATKQARASRRVLETACNNGRLADLLSGFLRCVSSETFDTDLRLLGTPSGLVDLTTGRERARTQQDMIVLSTAAAPAAEVGPMPFFRKTLAGVCEGVQNGERRLQRIAGSILLGNPGQELVLLQGPGGNGKSTLAAMWQAVLGTGETGYATSLDPKVLTDDKAPPYAMKTIMGKRLILLGEAPTLGMLREDRIKSLTGGDLVTERGAYDRGWVQFRPVGVPLLLANNPVRIAGNGAGSAMMRRLVIVGATSSDQVAGHFNKHNKAGARLADQERIKAAVAEEGPSILRWMIDGALMVQAGPEMSEDEAAANAALAFETTSQTDILGAWIGRFLRQVPHDERRPENLVSTSQLGEVIAAWITDNLPDAAPKLCALAQDPVRLGASLRRFGFPKHLHGRRRRSHTWAAMRPEWLRDDDDEAGRDAGKVARSLWATAVGGEGDDD
jgi:phage/plasmid-associated DNA primase